MSLVAALAIVALCMRGVSTAQSPARASGQIVWSANPAAPVLRDWASIQAEPGRITSTPVSAMPFGVAYDDEIRAGDDPGGYGERSELGQGDPTRQGFENRLFLEGQDRWIAFAFILGAEFPLYTRGWYVLAQIKQLGSLGTPILSMGLDGRGGLALFNSASIYTTSDNIVRWHGRIARGRLNEIVLHVVFSPDPSVGSVELYGGLGGRRVRLLMGRRHMSTMKVDRGATVPDHARLGQYREPLRQSAAARVYYGRYVVATSRALAETDTFG